MAGASCEPSESQRHGRPGQGDRVRHVQGGMGRMMLWWGGDGEWAQHRCGVVDWNVHVLMPHMVV